MKKIAFAALLALTACTKRTEPNPNTTLFTAQAPKGTCVDYVAAKADAPNVALCSVVAEDDAKVTLTFLTIYKKGSIAFTPFRVLNDDERKKYAAEEAKAQQAAAKEKADKEAAEKLTNAGSGSAAPTPTKKSK